MSFSYSTSLTSDLDRVRLNLADTDSGAYVFENEEITALLASEGSVNDATAACLRVLLADRGRRAAAFAIQGLSLNDTAQISAIMELLEIYGADKPNLSITYPDRLPMDAGFVEPQVS